MCLRLVDLNQSFVSERRVASVQSTSFMSGLFLDSSFGDGTRFSAGIKTVCLKKHQPFDMAKQETESRVERWKTVWCQSKKTRADLEAETNYTTKMPLKATPHVQMPLTVTQSRGRCVSRPPRPDRRSKQLFCITSQRPNIRYDISARHGADLLIQHLQYISAGRRERSEEHCSPAETKPLIRNNTEHAAWRGSTPPFIDFNCHIIQKSYKNITSIWSLQTFFH